MNNVIKKEYTQICKPIPKLSKSQKDIYILICSACEKKEALNIESAYMIYKNYGAGKETFRTSSGYVTRDWNEYRWKQNFKMWFLHTLGALIFKGCLTVLPTIDFSAMDKDLSQQ